jgi:Fe-S cluster assembly ATPase SufC
MNGKIIKSGTMELAKEVEKKGYSWIGEEITEAG